ncbi:MAG TPA: AAA family ATPase, partial [Chloroflexi bacterium]|nr:AAA family ATPase [Chloroflexota bacterium]
GFLVLYGDNGTGKTHLAAAIANHLLGRGQAVLFVVVPEFLDWLRDAFNLEGSRYRERFDAVKKTPMLILDDLGAQADTPWVEEKLFLLVDYRWRMELPTVVTTNHRLEDFPPRLASRLSEGVVIGCFVSDYRKKG